LKSGSSVSGVSPLLNAGIVWNEAAFKEYIRDPRAKIPDTKMIFAGIKNEKEAGDLWAYLAQFKADGTK
jgi:cytochrome c